MHESEAMDFVTAVLRGFLERIFKQPLNEETEHLYEPHMEKIRTYIEDENGHWVKEKALDVIHYIENIETEFADCSRVLKTPEDCVDTVLLLAQKRMQEKIDVYRTEKNKNPKWIHDFFSLPKLPPRK